MSENKMNRLSLILNPAHYPAANGKRCKMNFSQDVPFASEMLRFAIGCMRFFLVAAAPVKHIELNENKK